MVCVDSFDLRRFTNGNNDFAQDTIVALDKEGPCSIPGRSTFVIAADGDGFSTEFGFNASLVGGIGGPADSDGNLHCLGLHWSCLASSPLLNANRFCLRRKRQHRAVLQGYANRYLWCPRRGCKSVPEPGRRRPPSPAFDMLLMPVCVYIYIYIYMRVCERDWCFRVRTPTTISPMVERPDWTASRQQWSGMRISGL